MVKRELQCFLSVGLKKDCLCVFQAWQVEPEANTSSDTYFDNGISWNKYVQSVSINQYFNIFLEH